MEQKIVWSQQEYSFTFFVIVERVSSSTSLLMIQLEKGGQSDFVVVLHCNGMVDRDFYMIDGDTDL